MQSLFDYLKFQKTPLGLGRSPISKFNKNHKKNVLFSGFTLLELLIVIGIISIVFTAGYANFRSYQRRQLVMATGRQMEGDIRLAQEYASQGMKPGACNNSDIRLEGYIFRVNADSSFDVVAHCRDLLGNDVNVNVKNETVPEDWSITSGQIEFKPLDQGTDIQSGQTVTFTITPTDTTSLVDVVVTSGGSVTVNFR